MRDFTPQKLDYPRIGDLAGDLSRARFYIIAGAVAGILCSTIFILSTIPHYRAQMIVSPANPMNGAEMSSMLADDSLFALRYLAQRVGVQNSSDFMRFENIYNGPSVAGKLLPDSRIAEGLKQDRSFAPGGPAQTTWSAQTLAEYIAKRVRLEPVGATSLRRMVYYHPDPVFAVYFLRQIHSAADQLIRASIRDEAGQRIQYLQDAANKTANPDHKRALTTLLLEQERLKMLVSIDQPYAAAVIEQATASSRSRWPDRKLVFAAFIFGGALAGFVLWNFRAVRR